MWIKRQVFRYYKDNTAFWIVQTNNTANELCHHLRESKERIKIIPFYELSDELVNLKYQRHGNDYVYVANYYTGSKGHEELLEAWKILYQEGINKKLHLTIDNSCHFANTVRLAQSEGVQVVNHGSLPFNKITELYRISKAIIYPSHNESFGLGLVEAMEAGCDVIASDLPFVYAICKPSEVFEPTSPQSIADAVIRYEEGKSPKSRQIVENKIDEIISIISSS